MFTFCGFQVGSDVCESLVSRWIRILMCLKEPSFLSHKAWMFFSFQLIASVQNIGFDFFSVLSEI